MRTFSGLRDEMNNDVVVTDSSSKCPRSVSRFWLRLGGCMIELDPAGTVPLKPIMPSTRSNYCICKNINRKAP
jgi:hypothetical protein